MFDRKRKELIASEKGTIVKKWKSKVPLCVVFPNRYYIGMSNLAVHLLYRILNDMSDVVCERAFFEGDQDILTIESGRPLSSFECIFFTVSFELDYINIPEILRRSRIPVHTSDRKDSDPLVMAGGISVMANPEPLHAFFDLFLMGDIEAVIPEFMEKYTNLRGKNRDEIIEGISSLNWAYNPKMLGVSYRQDGQIESLEPEGFNIRIKRYRGTPLAKSSIISSMTEFANMLLIEGTRGCPSRCRFCLLGNIYDFIYDNAPDIKDSTKDIGLVGGGISFHPQLYEILKELNKDGKTIHFPSLRIDRTPVSIIELVRDEIKTLTFGIEAGSERLRSFIGKSLKDKDILEKIGDIMAIKPFNLKLYFMIGILDEKKEDIESIVELVKHIRHIMIKEGAKKGAVGAITVHVSPFVPKPATPFQWLPMEDMEGLKTKTLYLKKAFSKVDNTYFTHESIKFSFIQGVFARGDRRVSDVVLRFSRGDTLNKISRENPINLNFYALRERSKDEVMPWSFITT